MMHDAKQQITSLPRTVQNWMLWMNIVFLMSLLFVNSHEPARWVFAAYVMCFPVVVIIHRYTQDVSMWGVTHLLFWTPLLIYLPLTTAKDTNFSFLSLYGVWLILLMLTILISVAFDVREVFKFISRTSQR